MKTNFLVALATTILLYACSSKISSINASTNILTVDKSGKPMLSGNCSRSTLLQAPFNEWYEKNYKSYTVNDSIIQLIKPAIAGKSILIFLGTWCGDSKREVPRMLKILDDCGVKKSQVKLVMVDNHDSSYKQSPGHEERGLNIHRVPTMIVYESKNEIGRIVESPVLSIEKDLLAILNKESYKPNYKVVAYLDSLFKSKSIPEIESMKQVIAETARPILKHAAELNTYGYVLMAAKEMDKALLIFKLNIELFPTNANLYDSLGEYYFKNGNVSAAKENYRKVLELDPKNENARKMLEKMEG